ncbi:MAG: dihydrolipoyl dehydrogenase [Bacteroidaceae bacterium]|nr:dihydrolipoyl dehydrogenase [Bacteroidaceae bacterium]
MTKTDLIIIGAGPGGYRAAEYAAKQGLKVVIFEADRVGGTCLNVGCIPTKSFARDAEIIQTLNNAETFGLNGLDYEFDFQKVIQRKDEVLSSLRSGIETLLSHPNITLVKAEAQFLDANTVTAAGEDYTAPHIIVATGSVPKTLRLEKPAARRVLDSSDLLSLDHLPESLCIIGAGVIGMEFASIFNAFGTEVTVVEFLKECLPVLDTDIAKRLRKTLEKQGVTFHMQSGVTTITEDGVVFTDKKGNAVTVAADEVLMAVGRAPRVFDHFSRAGFEYSERTGIVVNEHLQTTVPHIYAIGDVNGRQMLAHAAEMQGIHVINQIVGRADDIRLDIMPAAIFTQPEAACVGLSEDRCKELGLDYVCKKSFWRANGKALAMNESEGLLKLIASPQGEILGCHAYGAHAADLIQEVSALMCRHTTVEQLSHIVHIHPTLSEILQTAAEG